MHTHAHADTCTRTGTRRHTHVHHMILTTPSTFTKTPSFWDSKFVPSLLGDRVAKNLLYIEALSSLALEHWEVGNDKLDSLSSMQKKALKKEVYTDHFLMVQCLILILGIG